MKRGKNIIFILLIICTLLVQGCSSTKGYPEKRNENWVKDIEEIQKKLPVEHANLYAHITEEDFNSQMEKLKMDVPDINDDEIQIRLMEILTPVQDTHLLIMNFYSDVMKIFSSDCFYSLSLSSSLKEIMPLKTMWFGDELIVVEADVEYKDLLGAKLSTINGKPIAEAMDKISAIIPHTNLQRLKFLNVMFLCHPQVLRHFGLMDKDKVNIEFISQDGQAIAKEIGIKKLENISFVAIMDSLSEKPLYASKDDPFWYEYLLEEKTLYFRLRSYGSMFIPNKVTYGEREKVTNADQSFSKFNEFLNSMIKDIEEKKPEKIVIDLRGNNGGYPVILEPLRRYISKNNSIPKEGCVFLLEDRGCFSAPILEGSYHKNRLKALIVGEPAGERPFKYGGRAAEITLPNSKLSILYAEREFKPVDEKVDTLMPDIAVELTFEDYQKGIDPFLKAVLEQ